MKGGGFERIRRLICSLLLSEGFSCQLFFDFLLSAVTLHFRHKTLCVSSESAIGRAMASTVVTIKKGMNVIVPVWMDECARRAQPQMMNICSR